MLLHLLFIPSRTPSFRLSGLESPLHFQAKSNAAVPREYCLIVAATRAELGCLPSGLSLLRAGPQLLHICSPSAFAQAALVSAQ